MNTFLEIWKSRNKIFEGIANRVFKKEHVEEIAEKRLIICMGCDKYDTTGAGCYVPGTAPCCSECGCCLSLKIRSLSSGCDLHKWEAVLEEEEEDKLNESFTEHDNI